jgi:hypothetical protein
MLQWGCGLLAFAYFVEHAQPGGARLRLFVLPATARLRPAALGSQFNAGHVREQQYAAGM